MKFFKKEYLDQIQLPFSINGIENNYYGTCPLCPTGPCLLYECTYKYHDPPLENTWFNPLYRHKSFIKVKKKDIIFSNTAFKGYYSSMNPFNTYYATLWNLRKIYKLCASLPPFNE